MNKATFLAKLRAGLSGLAEDEIDERVQFYSEMIDDSIEEGMSEDDAVERIGSVDEVVANILADIPLVKLVGERIKPKRNISAGEFLLIAFGFPLWVPVLGALLVVAFGLCIAVLALIASLWVADVALCLGGVAGVILSIVYAFRGFDITALAVVGCASACVGVSILMFFGCLAVSKGMLRLIKIAPSKIKSALLRKEKTK